MLTNVAVTSEPMVVITDTDVTVTELAGGTDENQGYAVVLTTDPGGSVTVTMDCPHWYEDGPYVLVLRLKRPGP